MMLIPPLRKGLRRLGLLVLFLTTAAFYSIAFLVMETGHYLGKGLPYWILPLFPAFLIGRLTRRLDRALVFGAAIPLPASLAAYLILFVRRSGGMRLMGWFVDLWPLVLLLVGLIIGSIAAGHWVAGRQKRLRRLTTAVVCPLVILFSVFQVFLLLSGFIRVVFFRLDLRKMPRDQAVVAMGDFFRKHYNYLEYKGIDWDKAVDEAAAKSRQAESDDEYFGIVTGLVNTLGDGHLRVRRAVAEKTGQTEVDLGVRWIEIEKRWFVKDIMEGSAADKAGFSIGTELLEADGRLPADLIASAPDWRFNSKFGTIKGDRVGGRARLSFMLRRPEGMRADLTVNDPKAGRRTVEVRYDKWAWPQGRYFDQRRLPGDIGYIRIARCVSDFYSLIHSFDRALEGLWDTRGLIIDIRSNPGGYGFVTDAMLDRFCDERIYYGRLRGSGKGYTKLYLMPRRPLYRRPVVVLIDEFDFSASELFAFAASAVPGVTLVGRPTGGVVSTPSQQKILLPGGLSLSFTYGTLTDAAGNFVVEWTGTPPDIAIPLTIDDLQKGRDRDLEVAVQVLGAERGLSKDKKE
jgi:C-terminal processing protease CtpA/Prc